MLFKDRGLRRMSQREAYIHKSTQIHFCTNWYKYETHTDLHINAWQMQMLPNKAWRFTELFDEFENDVHPPDLNPAEPSLTPDPRSYSCYVKLFILSRRICSLQRQAWILWAETTAIDNKFDPL